MMAYSSTIPMVHVWGKGGTPVVLLHGFMMRGEIFYPHVPYFSYDHQVIVPDLRGFGESKEMPPPYSIKQHVCDIISILDNHQVDQCHIIGFSMGGLIAIELASKYPNRINSLVLSNSFAFKSMSLFEKWEQVYLPFIISGMGSNGIKDMIMNDLVVRVTKLDKKIATWYQKILADNEDHIVALTLRDLLKYDARPLLPLIQQPTLVIGGTDDVVAPIHHARYLASHIQNARLKIFQSGGHSCLHTHVKDYCLTILEFLSLSK